MISYSIDNDVRPKIYAGSAVLSTLIFVYSDYIRDFYVSWWHTPSIFLLFGLFIFVYDKFLWKAPILYRFAVPNLAGKYTGTVVFGTNGSSNERIYPVKVTISQTWTKISMVVDSDDTMSHLKTCGFFVKDSESSYLEYTYHVNEIKGEAGRSKFGDGAAILYISKVDGKLHLNGRSFSTKNRSHHVHFIRTE